MKNLSLILNIILIIAVAFLFYKVYSKNEVATISHQTLPEASIVFVNSDSLLDHYDFFLDLKEKIEHKSDSIDALLKGKAKEYENEVTLYQKQSIGMTDQEKQLTEEKLMQKQQNLVQLKQDLMGVLNDEENNLNDSIHNNLIGYLREFNKTKNYNFILGYQKGGGILLANESLDITNAVIEGLNRK